ncbi:MAG TPA: hypothetical protein VIT68_02145 [Candidatus Gracilibacteria bacterium]
MKKLFFSALILVLCTPLAWADEDTQIPLKSAKKRLEAYDCENVYEFSYPKKDECTDSATIKEYAKKQWTKMHEKYYKDLEELTQDNKLTYEQVIDELYKLPEEGGGSGGGGDKTPVSKINQFMHCIDFVCDGFEECKTVGFEEGKSAKDQIEDTKLCKQTAAQLREFTDLKTRLVLEERVHRRQKLATVEEGMHRSAQLFFGVLEKTFKILREAIELERKIDIYVQNPLQKP